MTYDFKAIEEKWQKQWLEHPEGVAKKVNEGKKYYCLDMFPYPSGSGLHVGHWRGYVLSDVYARRKWLEGYNVLHPMGWDAFGLPAENDAIKKGIHPQISTDRNIANFKKQLAKIGAIYDWSKEVNTTDPNYYKWTQWIFLQMFKAGLAYEEETPINWCPSCLTGLANEEVVNGGCERCGTQVIQRNVRQWILRITKYADKLIDGLDTIAWPEKVKTMQRNWIGRSEGLIFSAPVKDSDIVIETFNAHFEAFASDTFVVIAPDHALLPKLLEGVKNRAEIEAFCQQILNKRAGGMQDEIEPEGIFTGRSIVDPVSGNDLPIWVASFALAHYGTGIVKCSSHDPRDVAFALKYNIPLVPVLFPENDPELTERIKKFEVCYTDMQNGILTAPAAFAGKRSGDVRQDIITYCVEKGYARPHVTYRLRDWVFSRQRYWGEPIPLVHCKTCGVVPVPEDQLPITLPDVKNYQPTGTGESPLAGITDWVNTTCPSCGGKALRETNTMPQWAGSCWYFLRYPNTKLADKPFDKKDMDYWLPVDLYVGGIEHAILHLLYARFYVKVLYDLGFLSFNEPFLELFNQGMVVKYSELSGAVEKMSKSKGNVVNPDDIVASVGSDVLRMYILFMGPPELDCEWQDTGLAGIKRFVHKLWTFLHDAQSIVPDAQETLEAKKRFHQFLKTYQERLDLFKPNTAISACMEWLNDMTAEQMQLGHSNREQLLVALSVMMPHMASELLETLCHKKLSACVWPVYDAQLAARDEIEIVVQVNSKLRARLSVPVTAHKDIVCAQAQEAVAKWLEGVTVKKVVYVPQRLVNFVI